LSAQQFNAGLKKKDWNTGKTERRKTKKINNNQHKTESDERPRARRTVEPIESKRNRPKQKSKRNKHVNKWREN